MMRRLMYAAVFALGVLSSSLQAQKTDPAVAQLVADYQAAYNKADSKTLAAMYTADALRFSPDGQMTQGRTAIEKNYVDSFAGPFKGSKLTLTSGVAQSVTPDVMIIEGKYEVAGVSTPAKGRYVNTLKREGSRWLLATVVTIPDQPAK